MDHWVACSIGSLVDVRVVSALLESGCLTADGSCAFHAVVLGVG
jgi:hypothetical protein